MVPVDVKDVDRRRFNRILKQMDKVGKRHSYMPVDAASLSSQPLFTVSDGAGWTVTGERKLQGDERHNPAFDLVAVGGSGTWLLDRTGSSSDRPEVKSVLQRLDRPGLFVGEKPLNHDIYRIGVGPAGSNIAIMDSSGKLHIYDAALNVLTKIFLPKDSHVVDHFRAIDTNY